MQFGDPASFMEPFVYRNDVVSVVQQQVSLASDRDVNVPRNLLCSSLLHNLLDHSVNSKWFVSVRQSIKQRAMALSEPKFSATRMNQICQELPWDLFTYILKRRLQPWNGLLCHYQVQNVLLNFMIELRHLLIDSNWTTVWLLDIGCKDVLEDIKSADQSGYCDSRPVRTTSEVIALKHFVPPRTISKASKEKLRVLHKSL